MKKIVVGITGASGSIYAKRMIEVLVEQGILVHVIATDTGKKVFNYDRVRRKPHACRGQTSAF